MNPNPFFDKAKNRFRYLLDEYQLVSVQERYLERAFGSCSLVFQSEDFYLRFFWDGKDFMTNISVTLRLSPSSTLERVRYGDWIGFESFRNYLLDGTEGAWLYDFDLTKDLDAQLERLDRVLHPQWHWLLPIFRRDLVIFNEVGVNIAQVERNEDTHAHRLKQDCLTSITEMQDAFQFLASEYGFRCTIANILFVRFETDSIFVNLHYDRFAYPSLTYFGPTSSPDERYSLEELHRLIGKEVPAVMIPGNTPHDVLLARRAEQFRKCYVDDILHSAPMLDLLREQRRNDEVKAAARIAQQEHDQDVRFARLWAEAAWNSKGYKLVIRHYESIRADLTEAEIKRLEFAKRQIS